MRKHFAPLKTDVTLFSVIVSIFLIPLIMLACNSIVKEKVFREGIIEYSITYDDSIIPKYDPSLRPNRMIVKYKNNNMMNRIEGASGAVSFSIIMNYQDEVSTTLIKLFNKKLYHEEPMVQGEYPPTFSEMPDLKIEITDEVEQFLGFTCNKAIATFKDSTSGAFEVLYTKEVDIDNPNKNTPFEAIDGVMLKFRVKLYDQNMNITAITVKPSKVSYDDFEIPSDYEKVNKETIFDVIYLLK